MNSHQKTTKDRNVSEILPKVSQRYRGILWTKWIILAYTIRCIKKAKELLSTNNFVKTFVKDLTEKATNFMQIEIKKGIVKDRRQN